MNRLVGFANDESEWAKRIGAEFENIRRKFVAKIAAQDQSNLNGKEGFILMQCATPVKEFSHETEQIDPVLLEPDTVKKMRRKFVDQNSILSLNSILYSPSADELVEQEVQSTNNQFANGRFTSDQFTSVQFTNDQFTNDQFTNDQFTNEQFTKNGQFSLQSPTAEFTLQSPSTNEFISPVNVSHTPTRIRPSSTVSLTHSTSKSPKVSTPLKSPISDKLPNILSSIKKVTNSFVSTGKNSPVNQKTQESPISIGSLHSAQSLGIGSPLRKTIPIDNHHSQDNYTPPVNRVASPSRNIILSTTRPVNPLHPTSTATYDSATNKILPGITRSPVKNVFRNEIDSPTTLSRLHLERLGTSNLQSAPNSPKASVSSSHVDQRLKSVADRRLELERVKLEEQRQKEQESALKRERALLQKHKTEEELRLKRQHQYQRVLQKGIELKGRNGSFQVFWSFVLFLANRIIRYWQFSQTSCSCHSFLCAARNP